MDNPRTRLTFLRTFLAHRAEVGSVTPSSRFLVKAMLASVDFSSARCIVEYGPGTGVLTRALLAHLAPQTKVLAFETNSTFYRYLQETCPHPQVRFIHDSAAQVGRYLSEAGADHADYILSCLPFATMPKEIREAILDATQATMAPSGVFIAYQYSPFFLPPLLHSRFTQIRTRFCLLNIPPAFVYSSRL